MATNSNANDSGGKQPSAPTVGTPTVNNVANDTAGNTAQTVTVNSTGTGNTISINQSN